MSAPRRILIALSLALAGAALVPAAAAGSTVQISGNTLVFFSVAAESNDVTVTREPTLYRVVDPGAPITPMGVCAAVNANEVTCPAATIQAIDIGLGTLDDRATIDASVTNIGTGFSPAALIEGEAGNDTLNGGPNLRNFLVGHFSFTDGPGSDVLNGGAREDILIGSGGVDQLNGAAGGDNLAGGTEADAVSGGPGVDSLQGGSVADGADAYSGGPDRDFFGYGGRENGVNVSLNDAADDGEPGEGDNVMSDIEFVSGGEGPDTLSGSPGRNGLSGDDGEDVVDGGDGRDDVNGGRDSDVVLGGAGDDLAFGGIAPDVVDGGPGDDTLESTQASDEPDTLAGGPGTDLMDYENASGAVTVTADGIADDGVAGENDNVMPDVEDITGSRFADAITGNAEPNEIDGGRGDDRVTGLAGPDGLFGGPGSDELDGGADTDLLDGGSEADRLRTRDAGPDTASCGAGADGVLADPDDEPDADCEATSTGAAIAAKGKLAGDTAKLQLSCPELEGVDCEGRLTLRKGKKKLGDEPIEIASGGSEKVKVKLKGAGGKKLKVDAEAEITDAAGDTARTEQRVALS